MPGSTGAEVALLVFARAPAPGRAKTRLIPRLGAWGAARLQARLIVRTVATALDARIGPVELHGVPHTHRFFRALARRRARVPVKRQKGADLGERMQAALAGALRRHRAAILVGSDCPALRPADLRRAARRLRAGCDVVLSPAEDGGYALIGARRLPRDAFSGIAWGGPDVFVQTVRKLDAGGTRWCALPMLWDLDRPQDLDRLRGLRFPSRRWRGARR